MNKLIQKQKTGWLAMAFMMLPVMLHAQDTNRIYDTDSDISHNVTVRSGANVCEIVGDKEYADLGDALAVVKNNQTIKLLQTINYTKGIEITGKSITFDLNGFSLNVEAMFPLQVSNVGSEVKLTGKGEFNATSNHPNGKGVFVQNGGKATVTNVTGYSYGVDARKNATVTVSGNAIGQEGVVAYSSIVKVTGNAIGNRLGGVTANSGSNVSVMGDARGGDWGVSTEDLSIVTVMGDAVGNKCGIAANDLSIVTVSGNAIGDVVGIYAEGGSSVSVKGDVIGGSVASGFRRINGGRGIFADDNNTTVTVSGNIIGSSIDGVSASNGSVVKVTGDVITTLGKTGVFYSTGVHAMQNATVTISGNVTGQAGVNAIEDATVMIGGDVIGGNFGGGVYVYNIVENMNGNRGVNDIQNYGSKITIDGLIKVPDGVTFISLGTHTEAPRTSSFLTLTHADHQPTSTKLGYLEYTDGTNYVWVKGSITSTDIISQPSSTLKASFQSGYMYISGLTVGDLWAVYNLSGAIVYQSRATAEEAVINLQEKGLFIIVSAGQSVKAVNF